MIGLGLGSGNMMAHKTLVVFSVLFSGDFLREFLRFFPFISGTRRYKIAAPGMFFSPEWILSRVIFSGFNPQGDSLAIANSNSKT